MKVDADNAATTKISDTAFDAMAPYFKELYGNPSSLYTLGQLSQEALYSARETVAKCLNCDMKEITFTSGGSEADNQAILTGAYLGAAKGKKHIIPIKSIGIYVCRKIRHTFGGKTKNAA